MIQLSVKDIDNITYLTNELSNFEKDKALRSGIKTAMNIFSRRGRINLSQRLGPYQTGNLIKSFQTKTKRNKLGGLAGFRTGRKTIGSKRGVGNHAHLVDKGTDSTKNRETLGDKSVKAGVSRGIMPGNNFWVDAFQSEENRVVEVLYKGVQRAVNRINARR